LGKWGLRNFSKLPVFLTKFKSMKRFITAVILFTTICHMISAEERHEAFLKAQYEQWSILGSGT